MRAFALIGIALAILGCRSSTRTTYTVRAPSAASNEITAERDGDTIRLRVPRQEMVAQPPAFSPFAAPAAPQFGLLGGGGGGARNYHAMRMGWLRLPIPFPRVHSIPIQPQMYAPYAAAPPVYSPTIQPAGAASPQASNAAIEKLLSELKGDRASKSGKPDLQDRAEKIEERLEKLIKQFNSLNQSSSPTKPKTGSTAPRQGKAVSATRAALPARRVSAAPHGSAVEQAVGTQPGSIRQPQRGHVPTHYSSHSSTPPALAPVNPYPSRIQMWPYRPKNAP